jgi:hypothetical protein
MSKLIVLNVGLRVHVFKIYRVCFLSVTGMRPCISDSPCLRHRSGRDARNPVSSCPWFQCLIVLVFSGLPEAALPGVHAYVGLALCRCRLGAGLGNDTSLVRYSQQQSRRHSVYRNAAPIAIIFFFLHFPFLFKPSAMVLCL